MATAVWKGAVLAESDDTIVVEGNVYFPVAALSRKHVRASDHHSVCGWKGTASYYDVVVDGEVNPEAAWFYPEPKQGAEQVTDRVAFWHGVEVTG